MIFIYVKIANEAILDIFLFRKTNGLNWSNIVD